MSDDNGAGSGSRWEPTPDGADPTTVESPAAPGTTAEQPAATVDDSPAHETTATPTVRRFRGRAALAGAGLGLVVVGGIGGYAIGHATGDDGPGKVGLVSNELPGQDGRMHGPRDGGGPSGGLDGQDQPGQTQPDQGQGATGQDDTDSSEDDSSSSTT